MDWEGGTTSGDGSDGPPVPCARARGRACLVLSLIVLVWNLVASAREFLLPRGSSVAGFGLADTTPRLSAAGTGGGGEPAAAAGGRTGPLSVRQRFLLGRTVDVNRAEWEEISGLPGISDSVARAIVRERSRAGPFRRPADLLSVRGIKKKRLEKILPFLSDFPNN